MKQFPGLSAETAELTVTIPSFTMALLIVISSFLVKRFGTKKMVLSGTALTAVGAIISMMAPNVATLLFARALLVPGSECLIHSALV
ncbi:MFS transporter [Lentilactobacillus parafarraginis]|uniref:MFS transporter n=1 Tax=Lentilactobacillus parafarraginis TaxID=390842 RepID=UPI000A651C54|nr:MFS transporter [Lentilactobacillus parafarraginis]